MAAFDQGTLSKYNSLTDKHLVSYFSNDRMRHHLIKNGLITKTGEVIPDAVYRVRMARREHRRRVRNLIAQSIIHKALEMERSRQIDIRKKIEEIAKMELVRRVREDRVRVGDEDCTPYFTPGNMEISAKPGLAKKRTQSEIDEFKLSPTPDEKSRLRLRKILPADEIESKHLSQLDSLTLGEYSKILQQQDRERINRLPYLGLGTDCGRSRRRQARLKKIKKKQKKQKESSKDELLNIDINYKPSKADTDEPLNERKEALLSIDSTVHPASLSEASTNIHKGSFEIKLRPKMSNENINNMKDESVITKDNNSNVKSPKLLKKKKIKLLRNRRFINKVTKSGRSAQSRVQSMTKLSILFHSPLQNRSYDVMVEQQPSGGNTLTLFRDTLTSNSVFSIISQRHKGFPFSLTFYINNVKDSRISTCCEFKHKPGKKIGGPKGHFSLFSVENASPCYKCRTEQDMKNERKSKDSKASEQDTDCQDSISVHQNSENSNDEFESDSDSPSSSESESFEIENEGEKDLRRSSKSSSDTLSEKPFPLEAKSYSDEFSENGATGTDQIPEIQNPPFSENYNNNAVENEGSKDPPANIKKEIDENKVIITSVEKDKSGENISKRRTSNNNVVIDDKAKQVRKNSLSKEKTNERAEVKQKPVIQTKENMEEMTSVEKATRKSSLAFQNENGNNVTVDDKNKQARKNSVSKEKPNEKTEGKFNPLVQMKENIDHMIGKGHTTQESSIPVENENKNDNDVVIDDRDKQARKNSFSMGKGNEKDEEKIQPIAQTKENSEEITNKEKATRKSSLVLEKENAVINYEENENSDRISELNKYDDKQKKNHFATQPTPSENPIRSSPPTINENEEILIEDPVKRLSISSPNEINSDNASLTSDTSDDEINDIEAKEPRKASISKPQNLEHTDKIVSNSESQISKNDVIASGDLSHVDGGSSTQIAAKDVDGNQEDMVQKSDMPLINEEEVKSTNSDDEFEKSSSSASNIVISSSKSSLRDSRDIEESDVNRIESPVHFDESELKIALPNDDNESSKPTNSDRPLGDRDHERSEDKVELGDLPETSNKGRASKMSFSWSSSSTEYEVDSDDSELDGSPNEQKLPTETQNGETEPPEGTTILVEDDDINFKRAKEISQLFENVSIDSIKLKNCELPSYVFNYIAEKLAIHQELKSIELSGCEVEISLLNLLAKVLKHWPNLEKLILSENQFTDYSLQNLIDMIKFLYDNNGGKNLKLFDLSNCSIQSNDLEQLIDMIAKNTRLETFVLSGNQLSSGISQDLLQALQKNTHLKLLRIENCGVEQSLLDTLDEQLRKDIEMRLKI